MIIFLILQYVFGMWTNLYATIPAADRRAGVVSAPIKAVTNGPAELAAHAVLGMLLVLVAISLLVRAAIARNWFFFVLSVAGLGCVIGAAFNGAAFVGSSDNVHSLVMAMLWAGALLLFVIALFVLGPRTSAADQAAPGAG